MDTFIDKLAQKRNAQEMIRANTAAEAVKMEQMKKQLEAYDELLQEIRRVNLKTAENVVQAQEVLKKCMDRLEALQAAGTEATGGGQALEEIQKLLQEQFQQSNDFLHRENVKVYRNVQAAMTEALNKQTEELKDSQAQNRVGRALLPISILILVGVAANLIISLLPAITALF